MGGFLVIKGSGATFTSTTTDTLISLEGGTVDVCCSGKPAVNVDGGTLDLQGPLLSVSDATMTSGGGLLKVQNGGTLTSATFAPLLSLSFTTLTDTSGADLVSVDGSTLTVPGSLLSTFFATVTTAGALLSVTNEALTGSFEAAFSSGGAVIDVFGGPVTAARAARLDNVGIYSEVKLGGSILNVTGAATVLFTGGFLSVTNTQSVRTGVLATVTGNGLLLVAGPALPPVDNSFCACPLQFIVDNGFVTTQTVNGLPVHVRRLRDDCRVHLRPAHLGA